MRPPWRRTSPRWIGIALGIAILATVVVVDVAKADPRQHTCEPTDPCSAAQTHRWLWTGKRGSTGYYQTSPKYGFPKNVKQMFNKAVREQHIHLVIPRDCGSAWCAERYGIHCIGGIDTSGWKCDGAWTNDGIAAANTALENTNRIQLHTCGIALVLALFGGPDTILIGGGGGCFFDIMWQMHHGG